LSDYLFVSYRALAPRLTLYLTQDQSQVFHAVFLENLSCVEIANKLAALVQLSSQHVLDVYIEGPCGIHVLVTDDVVRNMKDESMFTVELLPGLFIYLIIKAILTGFL
jgi:transcription factor CP2-like protein